MSDSKVEIKKTPFDIFVDGAKKGWVIATTSTVPNVLMAFVIIQFLNITGLLKMIGKAFEPVMAIFGLPGEAFAILAASWLSMGGGAGVAAGLYEAGTVTVTHLAIVFPAMYIMGSQVQYLGRVLGTGGVKGKYYGIMIAISVVNALISLYVMRILVAIF